MNTDRRTVLKGLGAGGVLLGGGLVAWQVLDDEGGGEAGGGTTTTAPPPPDPASSLGDALVAVGGRYLEAHPEEADRAALLAALPPLEGRVPEHPGQGLQVLADQAAADHESGDVVALDGWVLSVTECRAAALYAL
jgi:hypothetical protein